MTHQGNNGRGHASKSDAAVMESPYERLSVASDIFLVHTLSPAIAGAGYLLLQDQHNLPGEGRGGEGRGGEGRGGIVSGEEGVWMDE